MRLWSKTTGWEGEARMEIDDRPGSYGMPVLIVEGKPVGTFDARLAEYVLVEGTAAEHEELARAGYHIPRHGSQEFETRLKPGQ